MEAHAIAHLERVGEAIGRDGPAFRDVGNGLGEVVRIDLDEQRVVRRQHVDGGVCRGRVAVGRGGFGRHRERQRAAALGRIGSPG